MSVYPLILTIPKSTPIGAPVVLQVNSGAPVVLSGKVIIPPGPSGLAFFRLMTRSTPIYPVTGAWGNGDGIEFPFFGYWRMDGPPWVLRLEGYNLDDTYSHTISAYVDTGPL